MLVKYQNNFSFFLNKKNMSNSIIFIASKQAKQNFQNHRISWSVRVATTWVRRILFRHY